jgi:hypothetical protein
MTSLVLFIAHPAWSRMVSVFIWVCHIGMGRCWHVVVVNSIQLETRSPEML